MDKFEIILENEKRAIYARISWFIIAIQWLVIAYFSFFRDNGKAHYINISLLGLLALIFFLQIYFKKAMMRFGFHPFFLILAIAWIIRADYWLAALNLLFTVLNAVATRNLSIVFSNEEIRYPSFPRRIISWKELNNVIIKDGLLTIDFRNNRLIQQQLAKESITTSEKDFNEFCRNQLSIGNASL